MKLQLALSGIFLATLLLLSIAETAVGNCNSTACNQLTNARLRKQTERKASFDKIRLQYRPGEGSQEFLLHESIVTLPFDILIAKLQSRELKATEVLSAFLDKAINSADEFNCVTEFVPEAMEMAEKLDRSPMVKGPLHGLPVCFKDNMDIKGMDSTLGYSRLLYHPARASAVVVKTFEELGAIPFCKTNVPQTLASTGSGNPIFGETLNPLNKELSPGGSTSGTACMVGAGALKIGPATDIGGSARIPAHYSGVAGISLTQGRLSDKGITKAFPNLAGLKATMGLIADKPQTIASVMQLLVDNNRQFNYDPSALPIPWNAHLFESSTALRIGYFTSLAIFPAIGDTPKTVLAAKEALEKKGHKMISLESLIDSFEAYDVYSDLLAADGGDHIKEMLRNDLVSPSFKTFHFLLSIPPWKRRFLTRILPLPERVRITASAGLEVLTSRGLLEKIRAQKTLRDDILKIMEKHSLDLIISPVMPFPAPRKDVASNLFLGSAYCSLWNLIGFPAGVVPFGVESDKNTNSYNDENDIVLRLAKNNINASTGMPIGVQVVGRPYQDELVLRGMIELDNLKNKTSWPQNVVPHIDIRSSFNIDVRRRFPAAA